MEDVLNSNATLLEMDVYSRVNLNLRLDGVMREEWCRAAGCFFQIPESLVES